MSELFPLFCWANEIKHVISMLYTPQQNGIVERRNRTLLKMVKSMLAFANLLTSLWDEALLTVIHVLNNVPTKSVKEIPFDGVDEDIP